MIIITLVHGTAAPNAEWIQKSSPFATAISTHLDEPVRIEPFNWTGDNRHYARLRAAKELQEHIKGLGRENPEARQFIIGHSHGGNVALYAVASEEVDRLVCGVVCLSTPFIFCRPRKFPLSPVLAGTALAGWMVASNFSVATLIFFFAWMLICVLPAAMLLLSARLILGPKGTRSRTGKSEDVVQDISGGAQQTFPKSWDDLCASVAATFNLRSVSTDRLLIVRVPGDEATMGITAASFFLKLFRSISSVSEKIYYFVDNRMGRQSLEPKKGPFGHSERWVLACFVGAVILFSVGSIEKFYLYRLAMMSSVLGLCFMAKARPGGVAVPFLVLGEVVKGATAIIVPPCLIVCAFFATAFGFDVAGLAGFLDLSTESSPVGRYPVLNLSANSTKMFLWHSHPYADNEAIQAIVTWVQDFSQSRPEEISSAHSSEFAI